jgi:hypothetical protein
VFETIIEALSSFDRHKLEAVISVGQVVYEWFQEKIKIHGYKLNDNILLLVHVPQIEILKRASLFITHAGLS